jgi:hypothetical protein
MFDLPWYWRAWRPWGKNIAAESWRAWAFRPAKVAKEFFLRQDTGKGERISRGRTFQEIRAAILAPAIVARC